MDASLVFIVFVYVYVVIVNKHRSWLWITWNFVYGSRGCGIDNPWEQARTETRSQGQLLCDLVNLRFYQGFAHKVPGGFYKSCPEGAVDKFLGVADRAASFSRPTQCFPLWMRERFFRPSRLLRISMIVVWLTTKFDSYCEGVGRFFVPLAYRHHVG
jgi:hypothetical protein